MNPFWPYDKFPQIITWSFMNLQQVTAPMRLQSLRGSDGSEKKTSSAASWWLLTRCLRTTDSQRYTVGWWDPLLLLFTTTGVCFLSEKSMEKNHLSSQKCQVLLQDLSLSHELCHRAMLPLRLWHLGRIPNDDLGSDLSVGQLDFFPTKKGICHGIWGFSQQKKARKKPK